MSSLRLSESTDWPAYSGHVTTPNGIVEAQSEDKPKPRKSYTVLRIAHGGRLHSRWFDKAYKPRTIITLANAFAKEIAED